MSFYFQRTGGLDFLDKVRIRKMPPKINAEKVVRLTGGRGVLIKGANGNLYTDLPTGGRRFAMPLEYAMPMVLALEQIGALTSEQTQRAREEIAQQQRTRRYRRYASDLEHAAFNLGVKLTKPQLAKIAKARD